MKISCQLLSVLLLSSSCTMFQKRHVLENVAKKVDAKKQSPTREIKLEYFHNEKKLDDKDYYVVRVTKYLKEKSIKRNCPITFNRSTIPASEDFSVRIESNTDERFSSWKPYVSGLTVGLVPIKYNYEYSLQVENKGQPLVKRRETVGGWNHLLFVVLLFSKSKNTIENEIMDEFSSEVIKSMCP